jgi:DNA processing protein
MNFWASCGSVAPSTVEAEVVASVGLGLLPGIGPRTIKRWLEQAGSAAAVWRMLPALVAGRANAAEVIAAQRALAPEAIVTRARAQGMTVLALGAPHYPARLRVIADPPPALFVRGQLVGEEPAVAVVGARRATPYGRAAAARLAADLAAAGVCIVSGLARGIDAAAHQAALDAGGRTVAVLGSGLDVVYPREHGRLAAAIADSGALVSEFVPQTPPLPGHFPRRNRLISGLAAAVVVVEGAEDSGALVTVDYALDQGREVFAVPGSIFSSKSRAPHHLLRQGARVAESAADVLQELGAQWCSDHPRRDPVPERSAGPLEGAAASGAVHGLEANARRLLALLAGGPLSLDSLVGESGLPASRVAALVSMLEVRGLVSTQPGQMVLRTTRKV